LNALVTGAGGFLGRYLVERLVARGDCVRALCRKPDRSFESLGVETVLADVRNREAVIEACRGMEIVFHTAGIAGLGGPWRNYHETNTLGTYHVVEGCRRHGVGRLVLTSSPSVTFDGSDQCGVDESAPYAKRWLAHYPRSKALAEQHVLASNGVDGLLTCSLRPHLIWGPRDRQLIPRLLRLTRAGQLRRVGDGTNRIDGIYVENAVDAHLLAADALRPGSPASGRAYFISQGEPVNCWEWINQILALAKLSPITRSISFPAAWRWGTLLELGYRLLRISGDPPMTRFLAAQLARNHYFDTRRAREDFGFHPRISLAEGMRRLGEELAAGAP
jgi:nucleoside-diphosphate-sugar epimerase